MSSDPAQLRRRARVALHAAQEPVRRGWRRWVVERGTDDTEAATHRSCLVIAPHPDDQVVGCGATMARKAAAGTAVDVVVVTDGGHSPRSAVVATSARAGRRRRASVEACAVLGVDEHRLHFLGFEELTLEHAFDELVEALVEVIEATRADEVLVTTDRDWHPDHQVVHRAARTAASRAGHGPTVLAYPVWFWADGPWTAHPDAGLAARLRDLVPDVFEGLVLPSARLVSTEGFIEDKREAFSRFASQTTDVTGEPGWAPFSAGGLALFAGAWEVFLPTGAGDQAHGDRPAGGTPPDPAAGLAVLDEVADTFDADLPAGAVVGSTSTSGARRQGVDVESTMSVDNGALRLAPLRDLGFGRQGLAYGPFPRRAGLTLAVTALHSHHAAETNLLHHGRRAALRRVLRDVRQGRWRLPHLVDSLAVGFQGEPVPAEPRGRGSGFVLRSAGVLNGELTARVGTGRLRAHAGIEELPVTFVVALRERGAVLYASSLAGAAGLAGFPNMRPVAVDHADDTSLVWASIQQAVHGEVGHDLASRVEAVRVVQVAALAPWPGTAVVADHLDGAGPLEGSAALVGGPWREVEGRLSRSPAGLVAGPAGGAAVVEGASPAGLVHAVVRTTGRFAGGGGAVGLRWRCAPDGSSGWRVVVRAGEAELAVAVDHRWEVVACAPVHLPSAATRSLQVLDDGRRMSAHLDGGLLFDRWFDDARHADQRGVGVELGPEALARLADLEAHPRQVPLPAELGVAAPWSEEGAVVRVADDFAGDDGELAAASAAGRPGPRWERSFGSGAFHLTGGELRVQASRAAPNPGRTCYTVPWPEVGFADVAVVARPPGTGRGQAHGSRAGVVLWQDDDTHVLVNVWLDDSPNHDGSAVSMFFRDRGYERLYDSPWANVGRKVTWGAPFELRVACDGDRVLVRLDGEPVLYRRLTDLYPSTPGLQVRRVGVVANYEWGDDTGSAFLRFVARGR